MMLGHIILIYNLSMFDEDTYKYTLRLANVYYEGAPLSGNRSKN